ncbi:MAG: PQQ-binding-like beta-propeller repeat protein [Pirellulales bacterium]|nr:PQQ-binding-like beta-propeller repeat protein [Pirellulales bacterium]
MNKLCEAPAMNASWEASLTPIPACEPSHYEALTGARRALPIIGSPPTHYAPRALLLLLSAIFATTALADDNWSRFRGPNGSGLARQSSFPAAWSDDDYAWKAALPGKGHSSPVAWGDCLFVTAGDQATGELIVIALDSASGDQRWTRRYPSTPHAMHPANSYASSSPAADEHGLYVAWASPESLQIAALSHAGEELWRRDLGPIDNNHGFGISPIVTEGLVILACDNTGPSFVVAFDALTGDQRWRRERASGTPSYATPALAPSADGSRQLILCSTAEGMAALSPRDGKLLWQWPQAFPVRCVASPLVAGGLVLAASGEGGNGKSFAAVKPAAAAGGAPEVAYELRKSLPQVPTPVAADKLLFVWSDRGVVTCCDLPTGQVRWSERVGGNYFGSPVIAGDKLYAIAADGEVVALAAADEFRLLGRSSLGEASHATPAVHQGRMYLRTESGLACLPAQ